MSRRILVTGGCGFIGTHLCRALVQQGFDVRVLDLRAPTNGVKGIEYRQGDVRKESDVEQALKNRDAVFHLAALASVAYCQEHPTESTQTNLLSTIGILEKMLPGTRFIFSSTSAVYGDRRAKDVPLREDQMARESASFYASHKRASEAAISLFHRSRDLPAVIFRFFNVFGPGQDPKSPYSGVISIFSDSIKAGKALRLNGGGEQTRDFVSVHDIVRGLLKSLELPSSVCNGMPINLGSGRSCSIENLGRQMMLVAGKKVGMEAVPWREGDVRHSLADINSAYEILGWTPQVSLVRGLEELLN